MRKIKNLIKDALLIMAFIQAMLGWFGLVRDRIIHFKNRGR